MYVCICNGTTCQHVADAVDCGASTPRQVAAACGAGMDCGRCVRNLKATIEAHLGRSREKSARASALA